MAITVVTRPEQGYNRPSGNLTDAISGAMALYNLPQSMRLQMQRAQLENQELKQNVQHQKNAWELPGAMAMNAGYDPTTAPSTNDKLGGDGLSDNGQLPDTRENAVGDPTPAESGNSSSGGVDNGANVSGTSAEEKGGIANGHETVASPSLGRMNHLSPFSPRNPGMASTDAPPAATPPAGNQPRPDGTDSPSASSTPSPSSGASANTGPGMPQNGGAGGSWDEGDSKDFNLHRADNSVAHNDQMYQTIGNAALDTVENASKITPLFKSMIKNMITAPSQDAAKSIAPFNPFASTQSPQQPASPALNPSAAIQSQVQPPAAAPTPAPTPPQTPPAAPQINPDVVAAAMSRPQAPPPQATQQSQAPLWNDLPQWRRAQLIQQYPEQPNVAEVYNQQVMAANPGLMPASPEATMGLAQRGILPDGTKGTLNMTQAAQALNERMKGYYGGTGTGGSGGMVQTLSDSQGIPYAKIIPVFNPATGAMEMKQIDIPEPARATLSGLPQGVVSSITDLGDKFIGEELPKTFYGQIAPKYQSIVNLMQTAKQTGDYNQFRSMDVLNSYAGITRPGSVVRDSTIATDLEGSGLPNEVARHWEAFVKGEGVLSPKDLSQIQSSAHDSYEGYRQQVNLAKRPTLIQAHLRTGLDPAVLDQAMFPPSPGDEGTPSAQSEQSGGSAQDLQAAQTWLQQNPNDPRAAAVAQKIKQAGG